MKTIILRFRKSQSLMEVVIGIGVIGIVFTGVAGLVSVSLQSAQFTREKSIAQSLIHDMAAAVKGIVRSDWHDLWSSTGGVSYWPLDEGPSASGNNTITLDQISGNNGNLVIGAGGSNAVVANAWKSSSDCRAGWCVSLDGTDDYISITSTTSWNLNFATTSFSFGMWVYASAGQGTIDMPLWKGGQAAGTPGYTFALGTGVWQAGVADGSLIKALTLGNETNGQWIHLTAVVDRSSGYFYGYKNGVRVASTSLSGFGSVSNNYSLRMGSDSSGNNDFNGRIDDVRIYNRALSSSEVNALYSGVTKFYPTRYTSTWQIKEGQETQTISNIPFIRSFALEPVMRDGSNNIVASGGTDDALTKRVTYTVGWKGRTFSDYEYIFRSTDSVFTQTDWSTGQVGTSTTFTAPTGFLTASSSVVYNSAGVLSNQLGSSATLESLIFDTRVERGVVPVALVWQGTLTGDTQVRFQIASSNSESGPWVFIGNDGTSSSYYPGAGSAQPNTSIPISKEYHFNHRYFRYKIYLVSSAINTPSVEDISLTWKQ